jgi:hypothetical protein
MSRRAIATLLLALLSCLHCLADDPWKGKIYCGYQGWFNTPTDGADLGWKHYGFNKPNQCQIDLWPDMSETTPAERFDTPWKMSDGKNAPVYSSIHPLTVDRHFAWMKQHGIDGVFLQRFGNSLREAKNRAHCDKVLELVATSAARHGRTFCVMYDLSGMKAGEIEKIIAKDWKQIVQAKITTRPGYLQDQGKPVVAVWGIGFNDNRLYTLAECETLLKMMRQDPQAGGNKIMAGVPWGWRTGERDAIRDPELQRVIEQHVDIISPWSVGRYNEKTVNQISKTHAPDQTWCQEKNKAYFPVIYPGFSWANLKQSRGETAKLNQIPRRGGAFYWEQIHLRAKAGSRSLYVAMFDEMDEGTAIFKFASEVPKGTLGFINESQLPADHYLWLTGMAGKLLRQEIPLSPEIPKRK